MTDATLAAFACFIAFITAISGYLILRRSFSENENAVQSLRTSEGRVWLELRPLETSEHAVPARSMVYRPDRTGPDGADSRQGKLTGRWTH